MCVYNVRLNYFGVHILNVLKKIIFILLAAFKRTINILIPLLPLVFRDIFILIGAVLKIL